MRRIFFTFLFVLLVSSGCHRKSPVAKPAPVPPPAPAAPSAVTPPPREPALLESAPIAKTITSLSNLEVGDMNLKAGNCPQAIKAYEAFLSANPDDRNRDRAWFGIGICRAVAGDSNRDLRQSEVAFKRLIAESPASPYKVHAELILELQSQVSRLRSDVKERDDRIKKLSEELRTLKEIDLQRKPSRPE